MSDTFLPGSGFDTYESQDKVLVQMDGSRECAVAVRILQQQGFAVAGAAVRLDAGQAAGAEAGRKAAEAQGVPGRRPVQTARTLSARPQAPAAMTARFMQLCRRRHWHG